MNQLFWKGFVWWFFSCFSGFIVLAGFVGFDLFCMVLLLFFDGFYSHAGGCLVGFTAFTNVLVFFVGLYRCFCCVSCTVWLRVLFFFFLHDVVLR